MSPETFPYVFTQRAAVTFEPATRWHGVIFGCSLVALPICGARLFLIIPGMRQHPSAPNQFPLVPGEGLRSQGDPETILPPSPSTPQFGHRGRRGRASSFRRIPGLWIPT